MEAWHKAKVKEKKFDFKDFNDFYNWYNDQEKKCHYCDLKEDESQKLVMLEKLKSDRFPEKGIIKRGRARGVWLEIDRKKPKENYSRTNCVLSCYFCNNDKSDIFDEISYKKFMKNRYGYLKKLIKEI